MKSSFTRTHLRAVAYRMRGSKSEADDALRRVVFGFMITRGKISEIELLADPARLRGLDLAVLED